MGKALAIAAVAFIALGTYYNGVRSASELDTRRRVSNNQYEAISRSAALAGVNVAKQSLSESWNARITRGNHQGGAYAVQIKANKKRGEITSVGSIANAGRHSEDYTISLFLERRLAIPDDPPKFFQFAVATDNDITLNGSASVSLNVRGEEGAELNANVHTNGTLTVKGSNVAVDGFGTYSVAGIGTHLESAFEPNYNPTAATGVSQADPVPIPDFNAVDYPNFTGPYGDLLVDQSSSGPVSISGNYSFGGTRDDPYVWHISGDLTVSGNTTIDGYVVFVVDGEANVNNNLLSGDSGYTGATESSVGLYTSGNLNLGGNAEIDAQMFVGGDAVVAHGTPTIRGNIVTKGQLELKGTPDIEYRPASAALTPFWQTYEYTYHVIGYHEE